VRRTGPPPQPAYVSDANLHVAKRKFYDAASAAWMVKVLPGEFYITSRSDEILVTILGSCISACIRDPACGLGGMNHFMLPQGGAGSWGDEVQSTRYGNFAMEKLINELIKAGCSRTRMEVKVFGGGHVIESQTAIGEQNGEFVLRYLKDEGLSCLAQDIGGAYARRIQFSPMSGRVIRRLLGAADRDSVMRDESNYANGLGARPISGAVELFRAS